MDNKLTELKTRLREIHDLDAVTAVLGWDQTTYMPKGGAPARGQQMATLSRLAHEKRTDAGIGHLLDDLRAYGESLPYDSDDASLIRVARQDYERDTKVPPAFIARLTEHQATAYQTWTAARPANDFAAVRDNMERTLDLSRELAGFFPHQHLADPLIDFADYGMKAQDVRAVFAQLRQELVPIVRAIVEQAPADDACLQQTFPEAQQIAFAENVIKRYGYDFQRGRLDKTAHPFCTTFSIGDVRITTRVNERDLGDCVFSILHEAGHAMYEQGGRPDLEGLPIMSGTSAGVHESQSRTWENIVGRSRGFWEHFFPELQNAFPAQLKDVSLDTFYRAINKVQRSLIRTEADEVTYNLHVMVRFDFELALLEGSLAVRDLPEAWHERYDSDLGIAPKDDRDGVLQDVHWYSGIIGGVFQGYTLGNILSAQFYNAALNAHPDIPTQIVRGEFGALHGWLKENIYQHGRKFTAPEIVQRATGGPLDIGPYIAYLRGKYRELYAL